MILPPYHMGQAEVMVIDCYPPVHRWIYPILVPLPWMPGRANPESDPVPDCRIRVAQVSFYYKNRLTRLIFSVKHPLKNVKILIRRQIPVWTGFTLCNIAFEHLLPAGARIHPPQLDEVACLLIIQFESV